MSDLYTNDYLFKEKNVRNSFLMHKRVTSTSIFFFIYLQFSILTYFRGHLYSTFDIFTF
jgi:hypothetical protein